MVVTVIFLLLGLGLFLDALDARLHRWGASIRPVSGLSWYLDLKPLRVRKFDFRDL